MAWYSWYHILDNPRTNFNLLNSDSWIVVFVLAAHIRHSMINKYSASLVYRQDTKGTGGRKPIHFRAYVNRKRVMVSTYVSVPIDNWHQGCERIIYKAKGELSRKEVNEFNSVLEAVLNRGQGLFVKYQISGEYLSASDFKHFMRAGTDQSDFYDFIKRFIKLYEVGVSYNSLKNMNRAITLLKEYKKSLSVYELSPELVLGFEGFLRKKKFNPNTRGKHHRMLKVIIRKVIDKYGIPNPYYGFKIPKGETQRDYLLKSEVQELIKLHEKKELNYHEQLVLSKYLFSCHCGGLRISDIHKVGWDDVVNDLLVFVPEKTKGTNKTVKIPFKPTFRKWIEHQEGERFFTKQADQFMNRCLKTIGARLGWKKRMTFHTARHTFATGYLEAGGSIEILQQILRHGKIETTQVYVHITNDRMKQESSAIRMYEPDSIWKA